MITSQNKIIMLNVEEKSRLFVYLRWLTGLQWKRPNFRRILTNCEQTMEDHKTLSSPDELHVFEQRLKHCRPVRMN